MTSNDLSTAWESALDRLYFAFQPIVSATDGRAYGYEALLRGWHEAGFPSISSVFDSAHFDGILRQLDFRLRAKAFADFAARAPAGAKLFYNVDNRIFHAPAYALGDTVELAKGYGLLASRIVLELSERHELEGGLGFEGAISACREHGFRIAIDDFGSGYAGLKLLELSEPDIVKIDRHFVSGGDEPRKSAFLAKIVDLAHLMGVSVVAEGVETDGELGVCVDAGCDMIQGFRIARPAAGDGPFESGFSTLPRRGGETRRGRSRSEPIAASSLEAISPARKSARFLDILRRFHKEPGLDILPVVDEQGEPVGVYLERDFRQYVYSPYGIALLEHLETGKGAEAFLRKAPVAPRGADLGRILEVFSASPESGGVLLTSESRYIGFLPAGKLLSLMAERELSEARDQNPLTRLPGNIRVAEAIAQHMADLSRGRAFVYFDFDNFKPFNDRYGFRLGDRVIQLFAGILRASFGGAGCFVGHLGGDDFFAFVEADSLEESLCPVKEAADRFHHEAPSFYDAEDRERGYIVGRDRAGIEQRMPLIGVSAAVVFVRAGARIEAEQLSDIFALLKKEAKESPAKLASRELAEGAQDCDCEAGGGSEAGNGGDASETPDCKAAIDSGGGRSLGSAFAVFAPSLLYSRS
jgi:diguanylate cyclase (GGDEF)-like protein